MLASGWTRWGQLALGIVCLVTMSNLQYGWTLFINPIDEKHHWGRAAIQVAFTIYIVAETWVAPIGGYLVDRFGPRVIVCGSGALVAIAWIINSLADSLAMLYLGAVIAGFGAGPIFGATVGNALKWFPDRRGLATGLTAAGFGAGSALTVVPLAGLIESRGYEAAYLWFGLGQGTVIMLVGRRRLPAGGDRGLCADPVGREPSAVRALGGTGVLRLGRDLRLVSRRLHRHLRPQVRDRELRHALHRQGGGCSAGALGERAQRRDRKLDRGVRGGIGVQPYRGDAGAARAQAAARRRARARDGPGTKVGPLTVRRRGSCFFHRAGT
jgi:MFS family permease